MQKIREDPTLKKARLKSALARAKRTLLQAEKGGFKPMPMTTPRSSNGMALRINEGKER